MTAAVAICGIALLALCALLRHTRVSLGLPIAYLGGLLLVHLPGALAQIFGGGSIYGYKETEIGFAYATVAVVCFVCGVAIALRARGMRRVRIATPPRRFLLFCLLAGWTFVYVLSPLHQIPSLGAMIDESGSLWMLAVLLGLRDAFSRGAPWATIFWTAALFVYPSLMLLLGGFLSYGSAAIIIVISALCIFARSFARVVMGIAVAGFIGLSLFVTYFGHRDQIRYEVWGGAPLADRIGSVEDMFGGFATFNPYERTQAEALNARLNQNYFSGLAAERIQNGQTSLLYGRSLLEAVIALVPRAIWPEKPVAAGSGHLVEQATGLRLSRTTSWGVGNVMELQINFGWVGVVIGMITLGYGIGSLDYLSAIKIYSSDYGGSLVYFLPAVALIQPNGSLVELASGSAAALLAGLSWKWVWEHWGSPRRNSDGAISPIAVRNTAGN